MSFFGLVQCSRIRKDIPKKCMYGRLVGLEVKMLVLSISMGLHRRP